VDDEDAYRCHAAVPGSRDLGLAHPEMELAGI
jgi:hypothetical protein